MKYIRFLVLLLVSFLIGCNKDCDDGQQQRYSFDNDSYESLLTYYKNKDQTSFYDGTDTILFKIKSNSTITNPNWRTRRSGGTFACDFYYYEQYSKIVAQNLKGNIQFTFQGTINNITVEYFPAPTPYFITYSTYFLPDQKLIDTTLNGNLYSQVMKLPVKKNKDTVGLILYNKEFGLLSLDSDSLSLVRIP